MQFLSINILVPEPLAIRAIQVLANAGYLLSLEARVQYEPPLEGRLLEVEFLHEGDLAFTDFDTYHELVAEVLDSSGVPVTPLGGGVAPPRDWPMNQVLVDGEPLVDDDGSVHGVFYADLDPEDRYTSAFLARYAEREGVDRQRVSVRRLDQTDELLDGE